MTRRAIVMMVVVALAMTAVATPAMAQSSTAGGYDESRVLGEISETNNNGNDNGNGSSLPFTGLDLGIVALMGAGLLGTGLVIRRSASSRS